MIMGGKCDRVQGRLRVSLCEKADDIRHVGAPRVTCSLVSCSHVSGILRPNALHVGLRSCEAGEKPWNDLYLHGHGRGVYGYLLLDDHGVTENGYKRLLASSEGKRAVMEESQGRCQREILYGLSGDRPFCNKRPISS